MRVPIKEDLLYLLSPTKIMIIPVFIVSSFQNKKDRSWSTGEVSLRSSKPRFMRETKTDSPVQEADVTHYQIFDIEIL